MTLHQSPSSSSGPLRLAPPPSSPSKAHPAPAALRSRRGAPFWLLRLSDGRTLELSSLPLSQTYFPASRKTSASLFLLPLGSWFFSSPLPSPRPEPQTHLPIPLSHPLLPSRDPLNSSSSFTPDPVPARLLDAVSCSLILEAMAGPGSWRDKEVTDLGQLPVSKGLRAIAPLVSFFLWL